MFMSGEDESESGIGSAAAGRLLAEFRQIFLQGGGNPPHAELQRFYQEREADLKGGFVYAGVMLAWMDYSGYGTVVSEKAAREHLRQSARLRGSLPPDLVIRMVAAFDPGFTADSPASITYSKRYLRLGLFLTLLPPTPAGNFEIARFLLSLVLGFNDSEVARKRAVELIDSAAEKDPSFSVEAARALFVNDLIPGLEGLNGLDEVENRSSRAVDLLRSVIQQEHDKNGTESISLGRLMLAFYFAHWCITSTPLQRLPDDIMALFAGSMVRNGRSGFDDSYVFLALFGILNDGIRDSEFRLENAAESSADGIERSDSIANPTGSPDDLPDIRGGMLYEIAGQTASGLYIYAEAKKYDLGLRLEHGNEEDLIAESLDLGFEPAAADVIISETARGGAQRFFELLGFDGTPDSLEPRSEYATSVPFAYSFMGDPRMLNSFAATAAGGLMLRKDILPELTEYVAFSESYYDMFRTQDKDEDGLVPYGVWATLCRYMAANTGSATLLFEVARMLIERPKLTDMLIANDQDGDFPTWDPFAILNNASILALATASGFIGCVQHLARVNDADRMLERARQILPYTSHLFGTAFEQSAADLGNSAFYSFVIEYGLPGESMSMPPEVWDIFAAAGNARSLREARKSAGRTRFAKLAEAARRFRLMMHLISDNAAALFASDPGVPESVVREYYFYFSLRSDPDRHQAFIRAAEKRLPGLSGESSDSALGQRLTIIGADRKAAFARVLEKLQSDSFWNRLITGREMADGGTDWGLTRKPARIMSPMLGIDDDFVAQQED